MLPLFKGSPVAILILALTLAVIDLSLLPLGFCHRPVYTFLLLQSGYFMPGKRRPGVAYKKYGAVIQRKGDETDSAPIR